MATAKATREIRMRKAAARLDFLAENARILRSPELWERYFETVRVIELLGFRVTRSGSTHEVTPC